MAKAIYTGVNGVARKVKKSYIGVYQDKETTPSGLPTGYTQVSYIKSSGSQYIDTGVTGKSGLKIKGRFSPNVVGASIPIGCITSQRCYLLSLTDTNAVRYGYVDWCTSSKTLEVGKWYEFEVDFSVGNQSVKIDGVTVASSTNSTTVTSNHNVFLFAYNDAGTAGDFFKGKFEYVKIYDGDTLVRDFISCTNVSGTVGLYDLVNNEFYTNKGTGTFATGTAIPTILMGERARKVKKGYIGVNGVARQFFQSGIPITNYKVGDTLKLNVNGTLTDFIIVQIGKPSSLYDSSCDGYWLMMKNIYTKMIWDSSNSDYKNSDAHTYLNGTFLNSLDAGIKASIKQVKIPYVNGAGRYSSVASGTNGLSTKVFLLSAVELGWGKSINTTQFDDGTCLDYFEGIGSSDTKRTAYYNGVATEWWTRSPITSNNTNVVYVDPYSGGYYSNPCKSFTFGIRPVLVFDNSCVVSEELVVLG